MINIQLNKKIVATCAALMMMTFSATTSAALIDANSEIALFGTYTTDNADLTLATEITGMDALIAAGANDFAFSVGGSASFSTIVFNPSTPGSVFTFAGGGEFTASSIVVDLQTSSALDLTMAGVWSLAGFDDTAGTLILTADSLGEGLFTFSASGTVQPIPVPAAIWLFGTALAGLGLTRRRAA